MKVIVCVDDSQFTERVINQLISRRWHDDTQFKLLTVLEPISMSPDPKMTEFLTLKREREAKRKLAAWRILFSSKIPRSLVHIDIRHGSPVEEILNVAIEWQPKKIIMGAHNKGADSRFRLGSVSGTVVKQAFCTVEVLRDNEKATACG